jgi:hypothetical protein
LDTAKVATPELTVPVPRVVVVALKRSLNVTVPVGVGPLMVAVKVVEPPHIVGFTLEDNPVVDATEDIVCIAAVDTLVLLFVSPL